MFVCVHGNGSASVPRAATNSAFPPRLVPHAQETDLEPFIKEILDKWKICHNREAASAGSKPTLDVEVQLAKLLEGQKLATKEEREYTEEERRIKEQILSQYSQVPSGGALA